jgi:carbon monoxide dehydrogenase subunit G
MPIYISVHIELKKEYVIDASIDEVWNLFTDLNSITECIPNLEDIKIEGMRFRAKVKPPFSFIKGKFKVESEIEEIKDKSLKISMKGSSIGSSFELTLTILLANNTNVYVDIVAETRGLLKTIPKSLIQKIVEGVEEPMLRCMKEHLEH